MLTLVNMASLSFFDEYLAYTHTWVFSCGSFHFFIPLPNVPEDNLLEFNLAIEQIFNLLHVLIVFSQKLLFHCHGQWKNGSPMRRVLQSQSLSRATTARRHSRRRLRRQNKVRQAEVLRRMRCYSRCGYIYIYIVYIYTYIPQHVYVPMHANI